MSEKHWEQLKDGAPLKDQNEKVYGFENKLLWEDTQKTFYLTTNAVLNELNVNLETVKETKENAISFLREIAQVLYAYIYKKKPAILREKTRYFLTYDLRNRLILYLCMIDMIRYAWYSGGNIVGYQPAINFNETDIGDIEKVRDERVVSFVTDSILKTNHLVDRNFVEKFVVPNGEW